MEIIQKAKENKYVLKVVVLGDVAVGKSNIIRKIMGQEFQEIESTVGVEFTYLDVPKIDENLIIQIWDTSGSERYRAITKSHLRNADGAYLVYDVTCQQSFEHIDFWLDILKNAAEDDIVIYLVANKLDLVSRDERLRKVTKERAIEYSKLRKFQGFGECSALKNINIAETFESFCKTLYRKNHNKLKEKTNQKVLQLEDMKKKHSNTNKDCCA